MITLYRILTALVLVALTFAAPVDAKPHHRQPRSIPAYISTTDLTDPVQAALAAHAKGRRVMVVFDIDNTLLTMPQDLGSDTWFNWQRSLDDTSTPQGQQAFADLIARNSTLLELSRMRPTQPDTPALIARLQAAHIPVYALSARSTDLRGATEDALAAAGIDLSGAPECGPPLCTRRGKLTDREIRAAARRIGMKLPAQPFLPVTVSDGVAMVTGADKGLILHLLLASLPDRYDDVFFVDDTFQNVRNVQAAAPLIPARVHPYSYERFWPDAAAFMQDPARQAKTTQDYSRFRETLCSVMQAALCATQ